MLIKNLMMMMMMGEYLSKPSLEFRKIKLNMYSDTLNGKNFGKICVTLLWHRPFLYVDGQL